MVRIGRTRGRSSYVVNPHWVWGKLPPWRDNWDLLTLPCDSLSNFYSFPRLLLFNWAPSKAHFHSFCSLFSSLVAVFGGGEWYQQKHQLPPWQPQSMSSGVWTCPVTFMKAGSLVAAMANLGAGTLNCGLPEILTKTYHTKIGASVTTEVFLKHW